MVPFLLVLGPPGIAPSGLCGLRGIYFDLRCLLAMAPLTSGAMRFAFLVNEKARHRVAVRALLRSPCHDIRPSLSWLYPCPLEFDHDLSPLKCELTAKTRNSNTALTPKKLKGELPTTSAAHTFAKAMKNHDFCTSVPPLTDLLVSSFAVFLNAAFHAQDIPASAHVCATYFTHITLII